MFLWWQGSPLARPRESVSELPNAHSEGERLLVTTAPRLQIRVTQSPEPRVGWQQLVDLLEKTEGHQRGKRRDARPTSRPSRADATGSRLSRRSHDEDRRVESSPECRARRAPRRAP